MSDAALDQHFSIKLGFDSDGLADHEEGMHIELLRLGSFRAWPQWAPIFPHRLSRAGFYYKQTEDEVECFSCQKRIKGWRRGDRPMTRHTSLNPRCPFVQESPETPNVALPRPPEPAPVDVPDPPINAPDAASPFSTVRYVPDGPDSTSASTSAAPIPSFNNLLPDYHIEQNRMDTFRAWPTTAYIGAEELAQAGFVYMGSGDRVQCAFCKGVVRNWAPGDRAFSEHQRLFPRCQFVANPDAYRTAPRGVSADTPLRSKREDEALKRLHLLGVETDLPKNHTMALESNRMQSFSNWPTSKTQKPKILVAAGFYYTGRGDSVKCYWCDGGLRNWDSNDDVWIEHARWFPKCGHLKRTKGEDFAKTVTDHKPLPDGFGQIDVREVTARMDTPAVKQVLAMGFEKEFVRKIIHYKLATSGDDFDSAQALLETVLSYTDSPPEDFKQMQLQPQVNTSTGTEKADPPSTQTGTQGRNKGKRRNRKKKKQQQQGGKADKQAETNEANKKKEGDDESSGEDMDVDETTAGGDDEEGYNPTCRVCWDENVSIVFLPCRHLVCCTTCAPAVKNCPLCRAEIKGTINVFMG